MDTEKFVKMFNREDVYSARSGVTLTRIAPGYAEAQLTVRDETRNFMGGVHGGALFTLADVAAGCALISHGRKCVTLSTDIKYISPARTQNLYATAHEVKCGKRIGVSHVEIKDEQGAVVCVCMATMFMTDPVDEI